MNTLYFRKIVDLCSYSYPWIRKVKPHLLEKYGAFTDHTPTDSIPGFSFRIFSIKNDYNCQDHSELHVNFTGLHDYYSFKMCIDRTPGFNAFLNYKSKVLKALDEAIDKTHSESIELWISGHSMGGSLAQLFLVELYEYIQENNNNRYSKISRITLGVQNSTGIPFEFCDKFQRLKSIDTIPVNLSYLKGAGDFFQAFGYFLNTTHANSTTYISKFTRVYSVFFSKPYFFIVFLMVFVFLSMIARFNIMMTLLNFFSLGVAAGVFIGISNHFYEPEEFYEVTKHDYSNGNPEKIGF